MSYNQSRSDKNETTQLRKSGRSSTSSNLQRSSSSAFYAKGGGGTGPAPSSSLSANRSFKKSNNAQGGQSKVNPPAPAPPAAASLDSRNVPSAATLNAHNGAAHTQALPPLHGASDPPVASSVAKQTEASANQRSTPAVPMAQTSQPAPVSSDSAAPTTPPVKVPGDATKAAFPFQFGSLSPGFMNGRQIPARTSSAPPNLDEQKRDQARHDTFRSAPPVPTPVPKQQPPRKDAVTVDKAGSRDSHPIPKGKKDTHGPPPLPVSQAQKPPVLPFSVTSMPMPFHQPQTAVQFSGQNPQIQPQGVTATSLQMPLPVGLPLGNAPQVQQPMFVQGLQPHPIQPQGIMHQGPSLNFTTQMGPQLPPQLSNVSMGISSQYPQQQGGKYGGQRKSTVKITDPNTHEELRLADGGSPGLRSHPAVPQSQPIPSFPPPHAINYYHTSYGGSNLFFPPQGSMPLTSGQIAPTSRAPRFNYGAQGLGYMDPSAVNPLPVNKSGTMIHAEQSNLEHNRDLRNSISIPSSTVQVTVKPAAATVIGKTVKPLPSGSSSVIEHGGAQKLLSSSDEAGLSHSASVQKPKPVGESVASSKSLPVATQLSISENVQSTMSNSLPSLVAPMEELMPIVANAEGRRKEALSGSNSIKDYQKKSGMKGHIQPQQQVFIQSNPISSLPSHALDHDKPLDGRASEAVETKTILAASSLNSESFTEDSTIGDSTTDISASRVDETGLSFACDAAETFTEVIMDTPQTANHPKLDSSSTLDEIKHEISVTEEPGANGLPEDHKQVGQSLDISSAPISLNTEEFVQQVSGELISEAATSGNEVLENSQLEQVKPVTCLVENDRILDGNGGSASRNFGASDGSVDVSLTLDQHPSKNDDLDEKELSLAKSDESDHQFDVIPSSDSSGATLKLEGEAVENTVGSSVSLPGGKGKVVELTRSKSTASRVKKKRKEILQKADAAGMTSDLYVAYKGPGEKKENIVPSEDTNSSSNSIEKQPQVDILQVDTVAGGQGSQNKAEPDDWEDAVDMSTPKLETSGRGARDGGGLMLRDKDENPNSGKTYSRDFLLKFSERCTALPDGFETTSDILEALMSVNISHLVDRDSHPSPGRVIDRTNSGSRSRGSGMVDDDRWSKLPGPFGMGRDLRVDIGSAGNVGFRPGQGGNFGVLRNPRAQAPMQYVGGILSVPMQSMVPQGGMPKSSLDADRWQRLANFQHKGLIPSPQTPLQVMHKAERKYEVGKVADEEEAKQRQLKAILNKLTPQNFEKLFEQVKAVYIDNARTLSGVISQIFDKALTEPTFCEMYANFCYHLAGELPDFSEDNEKITFKRLLLNKCQEEFERGEREQEEANKADEEGEVKQSEEEREEKRVKARRQMLGNIRLIGELYKKRMLTERIMHECIKKLLGQYQNPDEEDVEALCKLMSTIGEMIDHPKAKDHMDAYFERMTMLSNNMKLSSRIRFMLKDAIDLRKNKWQQRRKVEGPKKIDDVHRDAAQERQLQAGRLARNPSMNQSARRGPMDFGPRGSGMLSSPNSPVAGFRGLPTQVRGYGTQDVRFEDRQSYEARTPSVPLTQRPLGDDSITLGPQGGLARGMSVRGLPSIASSPVADHGDSRRTMATLNGFPNVLERSTFSTREDLLSRFAVPTAYDQFTAQEHNTNYINRDPRNVERDFDRSITVSPPSQVQAPVFAENISSEKALTEEILRDKSVAAIKEYYSAKDEKEVALCIKELNSPSFHPSMISLWVTDSFERKDMERDLLAKLLVNLTRSQESILTQLQLVKGFESVLTTLEDAVNDAPKAAVFLGHIFAKAILENVVSLREMGQLLYEGGEEPGRLLEVGLAGDVLGSILETVKLDKGESVMNEIKISSNLPLEDFRPPEPRRSRILEKFI